MHMILLYDSWVYHIIRVLLHSSVLQRVAVFLLALQDILENCVIRFYCMILNYIILFIIMLYPSLVVAQQDASIALQAHCSNTLQRFCNNTLQHT